MSGSRLLTTEQYEIITAAEFKYVKFGSDMSKASSRLLSREQFPGFERMLAQAINPHEVKLVSDLAKSYSASLFSSGGISEGLVENYKNCRSIVVKAKAFILEEAIAEVKLEEEGAVVKRLDSPRSSLAFGAAAGAGVAAAGAGVADAVSASKPSTPTAG